MIITMAGSKGGSGKTTLALHLAAEWSRRGRSVLLFDADPQGSACAWSGVREQLGRPRPIVMQAESDDIAAALERVAPSFEIVIVDTAGRQSDRLVSALAVANLAILPCQPTGLDIWALHSSLETVRKVQEWRTAKQAVSLDVALVINGESRTKLSTLSRQAIEALGVPCIGALGRRSVIAESISAGEGVTEREPKGAAALELRGIIKAIDSFAAGRGAAHVA